MESLSRIEGSLNIRTIPVLNFGHCDLPFDWAQGGETFDFVKDGEPFEKFVICKLGFFILRL